MTINVTQDDIAKGKKNNCLRCPVALAVIRETGIHDVYVYGSSVTFYRHSDQCCERYNTDEVSEFIENFDGGGTVAPFSFELEVPD
jgi:hypothetical protein